LLEGHLSLVVSTWSIIDELLILSVSNEDAHLT